VSQKGSFLLQYCPINNRNNLEYLLIVQCCFNVGGRCCGGNTSMSLNYILGMLVE
jgi:hypothetical protein